MTGYFVLKVLIILNIVPKSVIELQFLHCALPLMTISQFIKFHLIPFCQACQGQAFYCKI